MVSNAICTVPMLASKWFLKVNVFNHSQTDLAFFFRNFDLDLFWLLWIWFGIQNLYWDSLGLWLILVLLNDGYIGNDLNKLGLFFWHNGWKISFLWERIQRIFFWFGFIFLLDAVCFALSIMSLRNLQTIVGCGGTWLNWKGVVSFGHFFRGSWFERFLEVLSKRCICYLVYDRSINSYEWKETWISTTFSNLIKILI